MNFLNSIISENLINAMGWTIIHSLWQGAAAALGLAVVMFFLRQSSARTRYLAGVMTLMLVIVMSMVTFVSIYQPGVPGIPVTAENGTQLLLTGSAVNQGNVTLTAFFKNYFNRHLPLVVTIWLLGVLVLVLRLSGGYLYNQRLKHHRNQPLPDSWQNRLETFCRQTGIQKPVNLVESALVKIPMTIGHFKPVILFPLGLATGLPRDQVEALLAHELAHILRKDYLVNILQSFVDILFYYHPGVRWISSHVRSERENCCDDIAVSLSGNSINVAKALTNIQGYDMRTPYPAMAAAGKNFSSRGLLARIKRLVSPPAQGSGFAQGTIGAIVPVVVLLTLMVSTNAAAALSRDIATGKSPGLESAQLIDQEEDKEKELQKKEQEEIMKLESKLKAEKKEVETKLQELVKKEEEALRQNKELDKDKKEKIKMLEKKLQEKEFKLQQLETRIREKKARVREEERELRKEAREREREIREEVRERESAIREEVREKEREMRKQEGKLRLEEAEMRKQRETLKRKQEQIMRVQETEMRKQEAKMREQEAQLRKQEAKLRVKEAELREIEKEMQKQMDRFTEVLVNELMRDQLISARDDFEFQFKYGKLYVNGKKQSSAYYKKYKNLYETTTGKKLDEDGNFRIVNRK
ncbi:MAG: M56 family metallopeptidase [Candidatus Aminicenantes bacterium]|jgi:beta-lactamase regulating signal transducer with metallopeptidase domain